MNKKSCKLGRMKQIIFHVGEEVFIYPLDKDGKHIKPMDRAKRKNYKKNNSQSNSDEEQQSNNDISQSDYQNESEISSPETNVDSINNFWANHSFLENINDLEMPIQNSSFNLNNENDGIINPDFWSPLSLVNISLLEDSKNLNNLPLLDPQLENLENNLLDDHCFRESQIFV